MAPARDMAYVNVIYGYRASSLPEIGHQSIRKNFNADHNVCIYDCCIMLGTLGTLKYTHPGSRAAPLSDVT